VVVRELLGAGDVTFAEATRIIGAHLGKPEPQYGSCLRRGMRTAQRHLLRAVTRRHRERELTHSFGRRCPRSLQ
jgi:hypothetical protein